MRSVIIILVLLALASPIVRGWTLAPALKQLFDDVNKFAPRRGKSSDGSIGDAAHSASVSDHNPDSRSIVHAIDITHDPAKGFNSYKFAEFQRTHPDSRIKYIISCRKIWNPSVSAQWRPYTGSNDHCHHVHVSLKSGSSIENNKKEWKMYDANTPVPDENPQCTAKGGKCGTSCSGGTFHSGLCAGPASVRCCVPRTPSVRGGDVEQRKSRKVSSGTKVNVEVNVNAGSSRRAHGMFDEAIEDVEAIDFRGTSRGGSGGGGRGRSSSSSRSGGGGQQNGNEAEVDEADLE
jgi:uncharacterized membrane protein YgcG